MDKVIKLVKVKNLTSPRSGKEVPNQFQITTPDGIYFQSYRTLIVAIIKGQVYLDKKHWNCSMTTGKYRNQFLGESRRQITRKINEGIYILADLNPEDYQ